jgi:hypothetical protein
MSVMSVLSGLATVAGKGYEGYGQDQQIKAANIIAQAKEARAAEQERITGLLAARTLRTPVEGDQAYTDAKGAEAGATAAATAPFTAAHDAATAATNATTASTAFANAVKLKKTPSWGELNPTSPQPQIIQGETTNPDGTKTPHFYRVDKTGGNATEIGGITPKTTGTAGGRGGSGALTPQALEGMHQQAIADDKVMTQFENDYLAGKVSLGLGSGIAGSGATEPVKGIMSAIVSNVSKKALGTINPRYQTYLAANQRLGNIMGNTMSRRYSDYQGNLDTQLTGMAQSDAKPTIALKQMHRADLLNNFPTPQGTSPTGGGGATSTAVPTYEQWLASKKK